MTLQDFIHETKERYRTQAATTATRRTAHELRNGACRRVGEHIGRSIWSRDDWDILVVLDACRNDMWNETQHKYDRLEESSGVISNASCSIDWIERNFNQHPSKAARTGYITGNPFANHTAPEARSAELTDEDFAYFAPLYHTEWGEIDGTGIETIPPGALTEHAISAWRQRESLEMDRLVVHYMQPHQPFRSKPEWEQIGKNLKNLVDQRDMAGACAWQRARNGEIDADELWRAVADNLEWVLDDVTERLLENVDGTVAISADHGNAMGEWGEWGHPPGALSPAVRRVPWVTVETTDSKTAEPGVGVSEASLQGGGDEEMHEQLRALGYK